MTVLRTEGFDDWLTALRDVRAGAAVVVRLVRLGEGNPGDWKPVGKGVSELRIDVGPGYRIYVARHGRDYVVLRGGTKATQKRDISAAQRLAAEFDGLTENAVVPSLETSESDTVTAAPRAKTTPRKKGKRE